MIRMLVKDEQNDIYFIIEGHNLLRDVISRIFVKDEQEFYRLDSIIKGCSLLRWELN